MHPGLPAPMPPTATTVRQPDNGSGLPGSVLNLQVSTPRASPSPNNLQVTGTATLTQRQPHKSARSGLRGGEHSPHNGGLLSALRQHLGPRPFRTHPAAGDCFPSTHQYPLRQTVLRTHHPRDSNRSDLGVSSSLIPQCASGTMKKYHWKAQITSAGGPRTTPTTTLTPGRRSVTYVFGDVTTDQPA